jgi:hypothetical protein
MTHVIPSVSLSSLILIAALLLSGCAQGNPPTVVGTPVVSDTALTEEPSVETTTYPAPDIKISDPSAYPAPDNENNSDIPLVRFSLDEPIPAGVVQVKGDGPGGTHIDVVDITDIPEIIGSSIIGEDNRFSIALSAPLEQNQIIAIQSSLPSTSEIWATLWELRAESGESILGKGEYLAIATVSP